MDKKTMNYYGGDKSGLYPAGTYPASGYPPVQPAGLAVTQPTATPQFATSVTQAYGGAPVVSNQSMYPATPVTTPSMYSATAGFTAAPGFSTPGFSATPAAFSAAGYSATPAGYSAMTGYSATPAGYSAAAFQQGYQQASQTAGAFHAHPHAQAMHYTALQSIPGSTQARYQAGQYQYPLTTGYPVSIAVTNPLQASSHGAPMASVPRAYTTGTAVSPMAGVAGYPYPASSGLPGTGGPFTPGF